MDSFFIVYDRGDKAIFVEMTVYHIISTFSKNKG